MCFSLLFPSLIAADQNLHYISSSLIPFPGCERFPPLCPLSSSSGREFYPIVLSLTFVGGILLSRPLPPFAGGRFFLLVSSPPWVGGVRGGGHQPASFTYLHRRSVRTESINFSSSSVRLPFVLSFSMAMVSMACFARDKSFFFCPV